MTYAFKSKEVAEALVHVGNAAMGRKPEFPVILGTEIITVKTPAAGIDARVGVDCSSAACTLAYRNKSGELVDSTDHTNVTVYNTTEEDIAGDQYIAATRQRGVWVASVSGGGGGGGGDQMFQLQNSAEIGAASGLTFGTGSASLLKINIGATAYEDAGEPAVTMINPFEEAVPSGAMITAYKKTHTFSGGSTDDRYVIVQVSCPAETP